MINLSTLSFKEFIVAIISNILSPVVILIFALSIMFFLWNVALFIKKDNKPEEREKFKLNVVWGIIAIFVMASVWGLVQILINSFVPGAGVPSFDSGSSGSFGSKATLDMSGSKSYTGFFTDCEINPDNCNPKTVDNGFNLKTVSSPLLNNTTSKSPYDLTCTSKLAP